MGFDEILGKDTGSKLCHMIVYYAEELVNGSGFEVSLLQESFSPGELLALGEDTLYALTLRKDLFFYEMFVEFDRMYRFFTDKKLIKVPTTDEVEVWAKIPVEFVKLLLKNTLTKREYAQYREEDFTQLYRYMGNSLFMYYQGLLYEYYCDRKSREQMEASVRKLLEMWEKLDEVSRTLDHLYLYDDEQIDNAISAEFQDIMEKVQVSEKYGRLMMRNLQTIRQVKKRRFHDPELDVSHL